MPPPNEFEGLREIELSGKNWKGFQKSAAKLGLPSLKNGAESQWRREWFGQALAPLGR